VNYNISIEKQEVKIIQKRKTMMSGYQWCGVMMMKMRMLMVCDDDRQNYNHFDKYKHFPDPL